MVRLRSGFLFSVLAYLCGYAYPCLGVVEAAFFAFGSCGADNIRVVYACRPRLLGHLYLRFLWTSVPRFWLPVLVFSSDLGDLGVFGFGAVTLPSLDLPWCSLPLAFFGAYLQVCVGKCRVCVYLWVSSCSHLCVLALVLSSVCSSWCFRRYAPAVDLWTLGEGHRFGSVSS